MANWHSSLSAMQNLVIGLARGRRKEMNRMERRMDPTEVKMLLRQELLRSIEDGLEDYFPSSRVRAQLAHSLADAMENFVEQR